jgi:hypothetical protein
MRGGKEELPWPWTRDLEMVVENKKALIMLVVAVPEGGFRCRCRCYYQ